MSGCDDELVTRIEMRAPAFPGVAHPAAPQPGNWTAVHGSEPQPGVTPGGPRLDPHGAGSRRLEACAPRCGHPGTCQESWARPAARQGCRPAGSAATAGSPRDSRRDGTP